MTKKKLDMEQQRQAAMINGIIQGYGLDKLMPRQERSVRRLWVKYFWLPLYVLGNPIITIALIYFGHWIIGSFMAFYTIYGWGRMYYGDRFILFLLGPALRILTRRIFK